ncbi:MAG TPA: hypothetical protein VIH96_03370 [Paraburkholderia sp.]|jgi:hypothetical protein
MHTATHCTIHVDLPAPIAAPVVKSSGTIVNASGVPVWAPPHSPFLYGKTHRSIFRKSGSGRLRN